MMYVALKNFVMNGKAYKRGDRVPLKEAKNPKLLVEHRFIGRVDKRQGE